MSVVSVPPDNVQVQWHRPADALAPNTLQDIKNISNTVSISAELPCRSYSELTSSNNNWPQGTGNGAAVLSSCRLCLSVQVPVIYTSWQSTSRAKHKTTVTPLLTHWSYCSLALRPRYVLAQLLQQLFPEYMDAALSRNISRYNTPELI